MSGPLFLTTWKLSETQLEISSKLHPMSFVLCKWIQYLRNILPIYPIAPLSAICGFSESKSHFWVWERQCGQCRELVHTASGTHQLTFSVLDDSMKGTAVAENTFQFVYLTPRLHWRTCPIIFRTNKFQYLCRFKFTPCGVLRPTKLSIILMFCGANLGRKWMIYS